MSLFKVGLLSVRKHTISAFSAEDEQIFGVSVFLTMIFHETEYDGLRMVKFVL